MNYESNYINESEILGVIRSVRIDELIMQKGFSKSPGAVYVSMNLLGAGLETVSEGMDTFMEENIQPVTEAFFACFQYTVPFLTIGRSVIFILREPDFDETSLTEKAEKFLVMLSGLSGFEFSAAFSEPFTDLEDCTKYACQSLLMAVFSKFTGQKVCINTPSHYLKVKSMIEAQNPGYKLENYERPLISAVLNRNYVQAEQIMNNYITGILLDPIWVFFTAKTAVSYLMRICQALSVQDPRKLSDSYPRILDLQDELIYGVTLKGLRSAIHEYMTILEFHAKQDQADVARISNMNSILAYIEEHKYNRELDSRMISDAFHISSSYFSRLFKEMMGINFSEYLQTLRISKARELISETELTLEEIAGEVGFYNIQALQRLFKKYEQMSPIAYKKSLEK